MRTAQFNVRYKLQGTFHTSTGDINGWYTHEWDYYATRQEMLARGQKYYERTETIDVALVTSRACPMATGGNACTARYHGQRR